MTTPTSNNHRVPTFKGEITYTKKSSKERLILFSDQLKLDAFDFAIHAKSPKFLKGRVKKIHVEDSKGLYLRYLNVSSVAKGLNISTTKAKKLIDEEGLAVYVEKKVTKVSNLYDTSEGSMTDAMNSSNSSDED